MNKGVEAQIEVRPGRKSDLLTAAKRLERHCESLDTLLGHPCDVYAVPALHHMKEHGVESTLVGNGLGSSCCCSPLTKKPHILIPAKSSTGTCGEELDPRKLKLQGPRGSIQPSWTKSWGRTRGRS